MTTARRDPPSRRRALARLLVGSGVFVLLVLLTNALVRLAFADLLASGLRSRATVELTGAMGSELVLFGLLLWYLHRRGTSVRSLGLRRGAPARGWIAALGVAALFIAFNLGLPLRGESNLWEMSLFRAYNGLLAGLTAGFVEEIFFRGFFMTELAGAGFGRTAQVTISAVLYGAVHSAWGITSGMFTMQMVGGAVIGTAVFGAFCSGVYLLSNRRLAPVITAHAAIDLVIEPWLFLVALRMAAGGMTATPADDLYFGQAPPGDEPAVFAPDIVSLDDRFEQFIAYAPDGNQLVFGLTNGDWSEFSLQAMDRASGRWSEPVRALFQGPGHGGLTVAFTADGREAYFTAPWPEYPPSDVWRSVQGPDGWSTPTRVPPPVSSAGDEWEVAMTRGGTLYFSSDRDGGEGGLDLYRAPRVAGAYPAATNLGPEINSADGDDLPFIAPDESYLIFASDRPGGLGNRDLYVSFRLDGAWTPPRNLGAPINSPAWDIYPFVSPDGRYLFFTRREGWEPDDDSDIYWVSAAFLPRLRAEVE